MFFMQSAYCVLRSSYTSHLLSYAIAFWFDAHLGDFPFVLFSKLGTLYA